MAKNTKSAQKIASKKEIWAWCSFDWANSAYPTIIVTFVFPAYFAAVIVRDNILAQVYWTWMIGAAAIIVAICAPILGRLADRKKALRKMLLCFSIITILLCASLWYAVPGEREIWLVLLIVGLSNIAFELSTCLYNALIPTILPDKQRGALSGIAWGCGYIGGLCALMLALTLLINPQVPAFGFTKQNGENIRAVFLLTSIWFLLFSIPFFIMLLRKQDAEAAKTLGNTTSTRLKIFERGKLSITAKFLLARMFYSDGVNTIFAVGGIFATSVHGFSIKDVLIFGILMNITAAIGAIGGGMIENRLGAFRVVRSSILAVLILGAGLIILPDKISFWICALTMGLFFGPLQSSSRVILSRLAPKNAAAQSFGWYALSGKATAFLGPLTVSATTALLLDNRLGLLPILLFLAAGLYLLPKSISKA